jgi:hypothetical protein
MFYGEPGSTIASAYSESLSPWGVESPIEEVVAMRSIGSYCQEAGVLEIDLLKIDVEGYELEVLKGAAPLLRAGAIRSIQWEFGDCDVPARTFFRDFLELLGPDFRVSRVLRDGLREIHYSSLGEVFWTFNAFADLRRV